MAEKTQVTQAYIEMLEKSDKVKPPLPALQRLARALKVTVWELLE